MANTKLRGVFFMLAVSFVLSDRFVGGRSIDTMEGKELAKHKGTVKTIEGKNGDMIDCVDIYQQPAFDHPLLKDHIIQMEPNSIPKLTNKLYDTEMFHGWLEDGQCPEGTIPIRHVREGECHAHRTVPPLSRRKDLNFNDDSETKGHEYATADLGPGDFYGTHATINIWQPVTLSGDFSLAQIWITAGPPEELNTIEVGWQVASGSVKAKFFIYWTRDAYEKTGCYNLDCAGFVQVSKNFVFGTPIEPVSTYGSTQQDIGITVHKAQGKWWLQFDDKVVGYWPESIFTHIASKANTLGFGGEIFDMLQNGHHTSTDMGSGHLAKEGYGKASYFRKIQYVDANGKFNDVGQQLRPYVTKTSCYDISINGGNGGNGTEFYFGGPGYSAQCP